ncbi:MAG: M23 family metallopeptidase [bacterium]|nr:M23 family metallopeptidase [bacterium]
MSMRWRKYEELNANLHKRFGARILKKHNKGRRVEKAFNLSNKINQNLLYLGEILIVGIFSFSTLIFGNTNSTPNNTQLVYPLQEVSTLECRTQEWANLTDTCKLNLPIIKNADYEDYKHNTTYTDIYTVLFGGHYKDGWAINEGSHYGIDVASAKGTPLYAIANGKVYFAGQQAGYGNVVKIQFVYKGTMYFATYGHMDQILVQTGQPVSKGQKI